jgi:hypothetical protein
VQRLRQRLGVVPSSSRSDAKRHIGSTHIQLAGQLRREDLLAMTEEE